MKICIVGSVFPRYDTDTEVPWHRETVRRCHNAGFELIVYAPSFKGLKSHTIDGVRVKRFRYFFAPWESLTGEEGAPTKIDKLHFKIITLFYLFFGTLGLVRLHLKEKFDIIHVHWPFPHGIFAFPAKFFRNTKIVLSFYTAELMLMKKHAYVRNFLRYFIKRADSIICISSFTKKQVTDIYPCEVNTIPYGATIEPKELPQTHAAQRMILAAGRQIERKGYEYLLQAMPLVHRQFPDTKVVFTSGGPSEPILKKLSTDLNIADRVTFAGKVSNEELSQLYANCSLFALPSIIDSKGDTEGLGVVLLEAFLYKKPVVASNVGGIPDIVIDDKTGILVPQKDPTSLAAAICRLLDNKELSQRLGEAGYHHAQTEFHWDVVIKKITDIYRNVAH